MATVTRSTTIARSPDEVFACLDDLEAHAEWQQAIESIKVVTDGPTRVGTEVEGDLTRLKQRLEGAG